MRGSTARRRPSFYHSVATDLLQAFAAETEVFDVPGRAAFSRIENSLGGERADAGHAQQGVAVGRVQSHGEEIGVPKRPVLLGVGGERQVAVALECEPTASICRREASGRGP